MEEMQKLFMFGGSTKAAASPPINIKEKNTHANSPPKVPGAGPLASSSTMPPKKKKPPAEDRIVKYRNQSRQAKNDKKHNDNSARGTKKLALVPVHNNPAVIDNNIDTNIHLLISDNISHANKKQYLQLVRSRFGTVPNDLEKVAQMAAQLKASREVAEAKLAAETAVAIDVAQTAHQQAQAARVVELESKLHKLVCTPRTLESGTEQQISDLSLPPLTLDVAGGRRSGRRGNVGDEGLVGGHQGGPGLQR